MTPGPTTAMPSSASTSLIVSRASTLSTMPPSMATEAPAQRAARSLGHHRSPGLVRVPHDLDDVAEVPGAHDLEVPGRRGAHGLVRHTSP